MPIKCILYKAENYCIDVAAVGYKLENPYFTKVLNYINYSINWSFISYIYSTFTQNCEPTSYNQFQVWNADIIANGNDKTIIISV